MTARRDGVLIVAGVAIGIVTAVVLIAGFQILSPGTGILPIPGMPGNGDTLPLSEGIGQLLTGDDVRSFINSHTETETETGMVSLPVSTPVQAGVRSWRYEVDTATFRPDEYIVSVSAITHDVRATALFNILAAPASPITTQQVIQVPLGQESPVEGFFIRIDPIGDHYVGDKFRITGTTNLPAGDDEMLVEVVSSSFAPTQKTQSGEFSGSTGITRASGAGGGAGGFFATPVPTLAPVDREYSTTNVQVQDVDEADIVKTDGTYIYLVSGREFHIVLAYPAEAAKVVSTTAFGGSPLSLYLYGDRIALICRDDRTPDYWRCEPGRCWDSQETGEKTVVYIFSVKDPSSPELEREVVIDGEYTDSRMIGEWLYFLTSTPVNVYSDDFSFPEIRDGKEDAFTPAAYSLEGRDKAFAFTTIGSVPLGSDAPVRAKTFLVGTAGTVYVSPTHLYFGVHSYGEPSPLKHIDAQGREVGGSTDRTDIYSFSLSDGAIRFEAHGTVDGTLLNQYAMDEHKGNLRLATTVTEHGSWSSSTSSAVTVLDKQLREIGRVDGIAPGERIYATRFMGENLYMVTFRETDPFFVIDLSDPAEPTLTGTLKLPGFSNYLHPYDNSHIIGVGKASTSGAVKLSLFDVSDISNPDLVDSVELGGSGSSSEALNDPKAFLFDKEKDILVLPLYLTGPRETTDGRGYISTWGVWGGAYVFSVDPSHGFSLKGKVMHYDQRSQNQAPVKRALFIENTLYTISGHVICMSDLANEVKYLNSVELR
jgi:uncharacterized secreted protein with C-terminal beta-propeller domain